MEKDRGKRADIEISPVKNGYVVKCLGTWYVGNDQAEVLALVRDLLADPAAVPASSKKTAARGA